MDSTAWQLLITTIGGLLIAVFQGILHYKLTAIGKLSETTHKVVNDAMTTQLEVNAVALGRISTLTQDPTDRTLAEDAARRFELHKSKEDTRQRDK